MIQILAATSSKSPAKVLAALDVSVQQGHEIAISAITYAELMLGAKRSDNPAKHTALIGELCERLHDIYPWDASAAEQFADLQTFLFNQGAPIGADDALIAAHVLSLEATLITNNSKHFSKVFLLNCINWIYSVEEASPDSL
ncbi:MAG: type II toxin-antitoxin system VapC family toxin [Methyloglobulus sp.]|nr:type II toxin-antitoxin system VapC family toxin [Methyloglobulus sp.]